MAVFQWPQRVGPASVASGSDSCHRTPSTRPRGMMGQRLGAGLPKLAAAAAMGPDPHRLADLQCRRAIRQRWLRAGSVVLGCSFLLLAQSQQKVDPSTRPSSYAALLILQTLQTEPFDRFCSAVTV